MEEFRISRKDLYQKVWSTPLTQLAKIYKISDVGLRKKCIKNDIPLPKVGHWSKIQHGKKVKKTSLPNPQEQKQITLFIRDDNGTSYDPTIDDRIRIKHEITNNFKEYLEPSRRLSNTHDLIKAGKLHLDSKEANYDKQVSSDSSRFLSITSSRSMISEALRVFNSFIRLAESRGHQIKIVNHSTVISIDEIEIKIDIRERQKRVIDETMSSHFVSHKNVPSGILTFRRDDYRKREWDNSKKSIEEQFPSIFANLEAYAINEKLRRIEAEKARVKRDAEVKIRLEQYEQKVSEFTKFNQLVEEAARWQKAEMIRSYINQMESASPDPAWLLWARKKADWVDPITSLEDEILGAYNEEPPSKPRSW
jgi:hypothetical protein